MRKGRAIPGLTSASRNTGCRCWDKRASLCPTQVCVPSSSGGSPPRMGRSSLVLSGPACSASACGGLPLARAALLRSTSVRPLCCSPVSFPHGFVAAAPPLDPSAAAGADAALPPASSPPTARRRPAPVFDAAPAPWCITPVIHGDSPECPVPVHAGNGHWQPAAHLLPAGRSAGAARGGAPQCKQVSSTGLRLACCC